MKKLTTEEFVNKANIVHNNFYDYSKSIYIDSQKKLIIICHKHGEFLQKPNKHLLGNGCPKCVGKNKTLNEIIFGFNLIHNNFYNYSKTNYINSKTKIIIICSKHGEFLQNPNKHLQGDGCPKCGRERASKFFLKSQEEFINCCVKIHSNKYNYEKVVYKGAHIKIVIICNFCSNEFLQTAHSHLNGSGCPYCANKIKKTTEIAIEEMKNAYPNAKYNFSKFEYITNDTPGIIICPEHGNFLQRFSNYMSGQICPKCAHKTFSKPEIEWLNSLNIKEEYRQFKIDLKVKKIKVDGFDPDTNTIYEFYGDYWHGNPKIYDQNDKIYYGKTFGELYQNTLNREKLIKEAGYNLITIWESDWKNK